MGCWEIGALVLVVLLGAVHRGRRGGRMGAILATLTYICMRVPLIMRGGWPIVI